MTAQPRSNQCLASFFWALGVASLVSCSSVQGAPSDFFEPDARPELLFDGGCKLTEGMAVGHDNVVYFSDISFTAVCRDANGAMEAGHIWQYDPGTGKTTIFRSPSGMANGMKCDAQGRLIVCEGADFGGRRVTRTDLKTGKTHIIAGLYGGRPFNAPNDVAVDEKGRIYFSDPRYLGHEPVEQPVQGVYRIDPDGSIHLIISDAGKPNGVAVSPDQKTLYVVSNDDGGFELFALTGRPLLKGRHALMAYDLAPDGSATFRKILIDYAPEDGPDGIECDTEGNVWSASRDLTRPGIVVVSPEGKEVAYLKTELPTNLAFGRGAYKNTLYITGGNSLFRIQVKKQGYFMGSP